MEAADEEVPLLGRHLQPIPQVLFVFYYRLKLLFWGFPCTLLVQLHALVCYMYIYSIMENFIKIFTKIRRGDINS